ncbi:LapA family protein [Hydrogenophaga sp. PAMC20947]|uniref:LapA family protein n=1 Tax=Hydrogenophaga sp. PAMC20947 TaxID=2565558 RepID=UPI00109D8A17|nr:LapA family protein [Hydrogenophaga sp. PAMC20947]QCB47220.1 LapA family protein [Hydrogenophaga sp. PAMC20947]
MERISHALAWGAVALTVLFAGLNWSALTATTNLNFLFADVQAPMGLILLGLAGVFVTLFLIATLYSRVTGLLETRRLHKELRSAQQMADRVEGSRFDALQKTMLEEFRALNARLNQLEAPKTTLPVAPAAVDRM